MSELKVADFYYGAILSNLINDKLCPVLIENGQGRRIYNCATNSGDFRILAKYRSNPTETKKDDYSSWQFNFSSEELLEFRSCITADRKISVILICGNRDLGKSEYAVLYSEDLQKLLELGKESITISRSKGEKAYRISIGGGRENAHKIPSSRPYCDF